MQADRTCNTKDADVEFLKRIYTLSLRLELDPFAYEVGNRFDVKEWWNDVVNRLSTVSLKNFVETSTRVSQEDDTSPIARMTYMAHREIQDRQMQVQRHA